MFRLLWLILLNSSLVFQLIAFRQQKKHRASFFCFGRAPANSEELKMLQKLSVSMCNFQAIIHFHTFQFGYTIKLFERKTKKETETQ